MRGKVDFCHVVMGCTEKHPKAECAENFVQFPFTQTLGSRRLFTRDAFSPLEIDECCLNRGCMTSLNKQLDIMM